MLCAGALAGRSVARAARRDKAGRLVRRGRSGSRSGAVIAIIFESILNPRLPHNLNPPVFIGEYGGSGCPPYRR